MKKELLDKLHPQTVSIHAGQNPDHEYGAVAPPIYQTSTFRFADTAQGAARFAGKESGYIYTRMGNPTTKLFEEKIAVLEGGYMGLATSSGMSAVSTVYFALLNQGDHVIGTEALYGPSRMIVERDFSRFGVEYDFIDTGLVENVRKAIKPNTKLLFIETPANPTIRLADIKACADLAHEHGITVVVDNTFMTPIFQRPLELGADVSLHSITKFINGHTDVVGGIIIPKTKELYDKIRVVLYYLGGTMDPHQAWLVYRGTMTLSMRVRQAAENAMVLAGRLEEHPKIEWVMYPGLKSHPQHELAEKQASGFGSLISFEISGGLKAGEKLLNNLHVCTLAVSLGGIETLIQHPASMTHAGIPERERAEAGITDGLVRLSVGCEHVEDLWQDLEQALDRT